MVRLVLYALFVASGAAGLFYEALWARYLGLFVGHTAYAQIIVLSIFLGGMAIGALLAGARSRRLRDPLAWYARVELLVAVLGVAFHSIFGAVTAAAYEHVFPALGGGVPLTLAKWTIAGLLILPQSILLGTTFPLMAAGVLRRFPDLPGRALSLLYFANSIGAAVGVLAAGFWFLALAGLPGTLLVAAGLNLVAAVGAFAVAQRHPPAHVPDEPAVDQPARGLPAAPRLLLAVAFGTAVASFIYEIGWLRMLALVLGSATHSFELMLSAFILGLALGALWTRKHADRWTEPLRALGIVQVAMGAAALATIPLYSMSFHWMSWLMQAFARSEPGYAGYSLARYAICLAIMLPATFCAGITLPLITRVLLAHRMGERAIGRVYGLNTLGSILGVAIAGLVLLPLVGLKRTLVLGGTADVALGLTVLWYWSRDRRLVRQVTIGLAAALAVIFATTMFGPGFDRRLLASSVYREGRIPSADAFESIFYEDGRTATVSAFRRTATGEVVLATNGKPDASLPAYWMEPCTEGTARRPLDSDAATQTLASLISLAHAPSARMAAMVGLGSGMSTHFMLASPTIDTMVTIEIEPAMVRGARVFYPSNRRVYDDPRSRIVYDDAKSYFAASSATYDVIVSEPSNPWVSGVASLFSTEFYANIRRFLTDEGVFGQWLHLYEIDDGLVLSVLAAIHEQFRDYAVYQTWNADIIIVATMADRLPTPDWEIFDLPGLATDLCHTVPLTGTMLGATRLLDRRALAPLLDGWTQPNSDYYPVLDLGAERTRFLRASARGFLELSAARFDFTAPFRGATIRPTDEMAAPVPRIPRMQGLALAAVLRDPVAADAVPASERDPSYASWRFSVARFREALNLPAAPASWPAWLDDFTVAERAVHGPAHGVANEEFYRSVREYLGRTDAPLLVRAVVEFRHGIAAWDFPAIIRTGSVLLPTAIQGERYLPPDDLLDALVTAYLLTGNAPVAGSVFSSLVSVTARAQSDFRLRLLDAYVTIFADAGEDRP